MTTDWAVNVQSTEMVTKGETKSIKSLGKSLLIEITAKQSITSLGTSLLTEMRVKESIKWLDKSLLTEITAKQSIKSPGKSLLTDYSQTRKRFKRTLFIIFI